MKQRTITGIILILICVPFLILGGNYLSLFVMVIAFAAMHEALTVKEKTAAPIQYPLYIHLICYLLMFLLIFGFPSIGNFTILSAHSFDFASGLLNDFAFNPLWTIFSLLILLIIAVWDKRLEIIDAMFLFGMLIFISSGLKGLLYIRSLSQEQTIQGFYFVLYIVLITCVTDTFAYLGGMTCYRLIPNKIHKFNERISPKKTWEGTLIGSLFGIIAGILLFAFLVNPLEFSDAPFSWYVYVPLSILLTIAGQMGDLILSAIKRHFQIKDYSNLLPGHGGILDRIDSLLVNCMVAAIFMALIL